MTKLDISHPYRFMSLNFVVVVALVLGGWLPSEPIPLQKLAGVSLIVIERRSERWVEQGFATRLASDWRRSSRRGPSLVIERWREWRIIKFPSICRI